MTVYKVLADIVDALRASHLEHEAIRAEMVTKGELAKVAQEVTKLGVDFEAFRHDTRITLDMIKELMARTPQDHPGGKPFGAQAAAGGRGRVMGVPLVG